MFLADLRLDVLPHSEPSAEVSQHRLEDQLGERCSSQGRRWPVRKMHSQTTAWNQESPPRPQYFYLQGENNPRTFSQQVHKSSPLRGRLPFSLFGDTYIQSSIWFLVMRPGMSWVWSHLLIWGGNMIFKGQLVIDHHAQVCSYLWASKN